MTVSPLTALAVIAALAIAPLARADARMIEVSNCNGGTSLLVIPDEDDMPGQSGNDCAKACHAMNDRRGKALGKAQGKTPGRHC